MVAKKRLLAALLLELITFVAAHGHGSQDETGLNMGPMANGAVPTPTDLDDVWNLPSYSGLEAQSHSMLAHVVFMVAAWLFLLPLGVVLSIARSRLAVPTQLLFLALNGCGIFFGIFYNVNTPDLYANNAHHKIGWIATWAVTAQVAMSLLFTFSGRSNKGDATVPAERAASMSTSVEAIAQHQQFYDPRAYESTRWSRDSGQGTECASPVQHSRDLSPNHAFGSEEEEERFLKPEARDEDQDVGLALPQNRHFLGDVFIFRFLKQKVPGLFSHRAWKLLEAVYDGIDGIILILGFIALVTGGITYAGIFRANNVFNGLAHFIKGGIFFWYGLLTLGRWMGCFAELGWAWNIKPSKSEIGSWKASLPTAEFTESFVIWLYGTTNVFLEHLAAWGGAWTVQDLEHVSISIMFFGGGLCGMLIESRRIRDWLNTSILLLPARNDIHPEESSLLHSPPTSYSFSMNPLPALIILLLGVMMSSHHQDSVVSTSVHKQWGTLLVGFALARAVTYLLFFVSPPSSIFPSRPPSELVAAFCLISGGLIFMASTKDVIHIMEDHDLMPMFIFTICMGFTAFLMAYEIIVLAIKGWATRRESAVLRSLPAAIRYDH